MENGKLKNKGKLRSVETVYVPFFIFCRLNLNEPNKMPLSLSFFFFCKLYVFELKKDFEERQVQLFVFRSSSNQKFRILLQSLHHKNKNCKLAAFFYNDCSFKYLDEPLTCIIKNIKNG